jgi:hypothetical protein
MAGPPGCGPLAALPHAAAVLAEQLGADVVGCAARRRLCAGQRAALGAWPGLCAHRRRAGCGPNQRLPWQVADRIGIPIASTTCGPPLPLRVLRRVWAFTGCGGAVLLASSGPLAAAALAGSEAVCAAADEAQVRPTGLAAWPPVHAPVASLSTRLSRSASTSARPRPPQPA